MLGFMEPRSQMKWSTTDKDSAISVSADGLTASGGGPGYVGARTVKKMVPNQKVYFEVHVDATATACGFGVANAAAPLSYPGADGNGVGYADFGSWEYNGSGTPNSLVAAATGDTLCWALDGVNDTAYVKINAGNWQNVSGDNPATNTGGFSCPLVFSGGHLMAMYTSSDSAGSYTLKAGATGFTYTPPAGFRAPDSMADG